MKTFITLVLSVIIGIQFTVAQEKSSEPANPPKKTTEAQPLKAAQPDAATTTPQAPPSTIEWNEMIHNFGQILQGAPAAVTFTFTNTGEEPVVIAAARSSCGCTVAEYTKEPVKPGASGTVKATYNSARAGSFNKSVTVTFQGSTTPFVLTIKGVVEAKPVESGTPNP